MTVPKVDQVRDHITKVTDAAQAVRDTADRVAADAITARDAAAKPAPAPGG